MKKTVYHGCGHFWMRAGLHFDNETQIIESWKYIHPSETPGVTPNSVSYFESVARQVFGSFQ